jgi:hypothetical protein
MESDHDSGQDRSQVWTMKHVSGRTENCDCRKFKDDYDKNCLLILFIRASGDAG